MNAFSYVIGLAILVLVVGAGYFYTANKTEAPSNDTDSGETDVMDKEDNSVFDNDNPQVNDSQQTDATTKPGTDSSTPKSSSGTSGSGQTTTPTAPSPTPTPTTPSVKTVTVNYSQSGYSPATIEINVGDTVKWVSSGASMWTASNNHPTHTILPEFDQKSVGNTYQFTFTKSGTWGYHNHVSAGHGGTVIVK